jgi:Raf kinase inhibitor-like YbhB/YbcL family protein
MIQRRPNSLTAPISGAALLALGLLFLNAGASLAEPAKLAVRGDGIQEGAPMPKKFTADGEDQSPSISWSKVPPGTKSIAITLTDPDAPRGTWWHWILFNIKPDESKIDRVEKVAALANGVMQGRNDFGKTGYNGPDPPPGKVHHYFFRVMALDTVLALKANCNKQEFNQAIQGHVLAEGDLTATYKR